METCTANAHWCDLMQIIVFYRKCVCFLCTHNQWSSGMYNFTHRWRSLRIHSLALRTGMTLEWNHQLSPKLEPSIGEVGLSERQFSKTCFHEQEKCKILQDEGSKRTAFAFGHSYYVFYYSFRRAKQQLTDDFAWKLYPHSRLNWQQSKTSAIYWKRCTY